LALAALAGGAYYVLHARAAVPSAGAGAGAAAGDVAGAASSGAHEAAPRGRSKHHAVAELLSSAAPAQVGDARPTRAGLQDEFFAVNPIQMIPHSAVSTSA
jgi:hypothetical protein